MLGDVVQPEPGERDQMPPGERRDLGPDRDNREEMTVARCTVHELVSYNQQGAHGCLKLVLVSYKALVAQQGARGCLEKQTRMDSFQRTRRGLGVILELLAMMMTRRTELCFQEVKGHWRSFLHRRFKSGVKLASGGCLSLACSEPPGNGGDVWLEMSRNVCKDDGTAGRRLDPSPAISRGSAHKHKTNEDK